ncbi:unnamed protein product [Allacma fusca]|uniref:Alpha,alpha-trehalose glucohydrolase n=1 Tax=Allacma fusca TaxID=39272 RepID=A0A8J2LS19_9HEXA|nr:unnamed protein product [Allacma fusca]
MATARLALLSNIYCYGDLLHTVQMARIYKDSKTFVDMKLKFPPDQVRENFESFKKTHSNITKNELQKFVESNFDPEGSEFEEWYPSDWKEKPAFLARIKDPNYRGWAMKIHEFWKELGRKIKEDVKHRPELYSMIYVSNPVIVPGGRFREIFYWDSYWIFEGLLLSEMHDTVKGMLKNFLEMVDSIGYVPNGGRVYFERSQPPLLIPMFKIYLDATKDIEFLRSSLPTLVKEFDFWMNNRTVQITRKGKNYTLARYNVELTGPRPESYREDYELAEHLGTEEEKEELYFNLKAGAESGWDFSSRWYRLPPGVTTGSLGYTKTRDISPVDLNSFLYLNAKLLAEFHQMVGDSQKATEYENIANEWRMMINEVLWDDELGSWFDYDIVQDELRKEFYPTNIVPLWAGAQPSNSTVHRLLTYLRSLKVLKFPGGVPTSTEQSGEQWDYPNGWPPLQHLLVEALEQSGDAEAKELAFELAERWIESNYIAFYQSQPHHMFEKYDVSVKGLRGGGGEYDVVVGFGWSNGVVLDFLNRYGDRLFTKNQRAQIAGASSAMSPVLTTSVSLCGIIILLASIYGIIEVGRRLRSGNCDGRHPSRDRFPGYWYGSLASPQPQTQLIMHNNDKTMPEATQLHPQIHK